MITGPGPCCAGPLPDPEFYGRIEVMANRVYLRNTVSGVVEDYDAKTAARLFKIFPQILVEVESLKNEVLAAPYTVEPATGKRKRLKEPAKDVSDPVDPAAEDKDN